MTRRAFTLIELVGVIGVIAVLASILFPTSLPARGPRRRASPARITSSRSAWPCAWYAADHDGS